MSHLIAIVGPTAVGKSALALQLAQLLGGEIVSADSRQVYRYMDIGTDKPTVRERAIIPHHLIDVVDPDEGFTLAHYQESAIEAIGDIQRRDKLAFLVGGSGLYVRAVVEGLRIPQVPPNMELRQSLENKVARQGFQMLYEELVHVDPVAAERIDPRNVRRVIRAIEVFTLTGTPVSQLQGNAPPFHSLLLGLNTSREDLYNRIDSRVDKMMECGLLDEVKGLIERGYSPSLPSMSGIGYNQMVQHIQGDLGLEEAVNQIKYATHRLARHQYAWFHPGNDSIRWLDIRQAALGTIQDVIRAFISERKGSKTVKQPT